MDPVARVGAPGSIRGTTQTAGVGGTEQRVGAGGLWLQGGGVGVWKWSSDQRRGGRRRPEAEVGGGVQRRGCGGGGVVGAERIGGSPITHNSPGDVVRRGGRRRGRFLPRQPQGDHEEHLPAAGAGPGGGAQHPPAPRSSRRPPRQGPAPAPRWAPPGRRVPRRIRAPAPGCGRRRGGRRGGLRSPSATLRR